MVIWYFKSINNSDNGRISNNNNDSSNKVDFIKLDLIKKLVR